MAIPDNHDRLAQHQIAHLSGRCAERHADPDLLRSLAYRVRERGSIAATAACTSKRTLSGGTSVATTCVRA